MKFLLFDIDGTLIDSGGAGCRAMDTAFEELFSIREAFRTINMAGKTDGQIIREGMELHGIDSSNGVVPEFFRSYIRHLKENLGLRSGHVKPGIVDALDSLNGRRGYITGLLTGNIEAGAWLKLDTFGIGSYFEVGAFGSDDNDRNNLLPIAVEKLFARRALRVPYSDCVVIGDTPRDVECAKLHGAAVVGVATGPYTVKTLADAGADAVFADLSDTGRFIGTLERL